MCNESSPLAPPSANNYFSEIDTTNLILTILALVSTCITCFLSALHLYTINRFVADKISRDLLRWLAAVFPITSLFSCIGICIPRSLRMISAMNQIYFARVLFVFVFLVRHLFGGYEAQKAKLDTGVKLYTPPCCCLCCLPRLRPTKNRLHFIELMTWQAALLRPMLYFMLLIIVVDSGRDAPSRLYETIDIAGTISGLFAVWGANIIAEMAKKPLAHHQVFTIVRLLQLILLIHNLQAPLMDCLASLKVIDCTEVLPAKTKASLWHHVCLVVEMTFLSLMTTFALRPSRCALFDQNKSHETVQLQDDECVVVPIPI